MHQNTSIFEQAIEKLQNSLDKDIAWRKIELANLKNEIDSKFDANNQEYSFLIRGAIALIYAHWEGSIKAQLASYVKFLNSLLSKNYISIDKYDDCILDLIFYPVTKTLSQNTLDKRIKGINEFKKLYFDKNVIEIKSNEVIKTKSNLSYEVLTELCKKFDLNTIDNIEQKFIEQLLEDRNAIAHGENRYSIIDNSLKEKISNNSTKIISFIEIIKNNILLKAEGYKQ